MATDVSSKPDPITSRHPDGLAPGIPVMLGDGREWVIPKIIARPTDDIDADLGRVHLYAGDRRATELAGCVKAMIEACDPWIDCDPKIQRMHLANLSAASLRMNYPGLTFFQATMLTDIGLNGRYLARVQEVTLLCMDPKAWAFQSFHAPVRVLDN